MVITGMVVVTYCGIKCHRIKTSGFLPGFRHLKMQAFEEFQLDDDHESSIYIYIC